MIWLVNTPQGGVRHGRQCRSLPRKDTHRCALAPQPKLGPDLDLAQRGPGRRPALDHDFTRKHRRFVLSSLLIPAVVVGLAFFNLSLLLTAFFFWASIHVLPQIIFITELYNQREEKGLSLFSRAADYGVS